MTLKIRILFDEVFLFLAPEEIDPLDMMEAVNVIDRLPADFFDKIVSFQLIDYLFDSIFSFKESKQWKDRKEVLDELVKLLTQNPKLAPEADYFELIKALSKV